MTPLTQMQNKTLVSASVHKICKVRMWKIEKNRRAYYYTVEVEHLQGLVFVIAYSASFKKFDQAEEVYKALSESFSKIL